MTCTFFGHNDTADNIDKKLLDVLAELIENKNANHFLVGNQGKFDLIALHCLHKLKADFPHIDYSIVLAYLPANNTSFPCSTIYPEGLETVPLRYAIDRRNPWMVSRSDYVITFVQRSFGGAAKFKKLAINSGKTVIELSEHTYTY